MPRHESSYPNWTVDSTDPDPLFWEVDLYDPDGSLGKYNWYSVWLMLRLPGKVWPCLQIVKFVDEDKYRVCIERGFTQSPMKSSPEWYVLPAFDTLDALLAALPALYILETGTALPPIPPFAYVHKRLIHD